MEELNRKLLSEAAYSIQEKAKKVVKGNKKQKNEFIDDQPQPASEYPFPPADFDDQGIIHDAS